MEVEKPLDFPTPSEPLIKAKGVERTPLAFIFANARLLPRIKKNDVPNLPRQVRPVRFLLYDYLPEHYKNLAGSRRR